MTVSVIISTMNRKSMLLRLVNNLAEQELTPNEVIIVEAGDVNWNENMMPKNLQTDYIFISAVDTSLAEARDIGRMKSCGEILVFLDDDVILPKNYILDASKFLTGSDLMMGVGGVYRDTSPSKRSSWKTIIGRILGIYSNGKKNKILKSGWADYVRGSYTDKPSYADWLFGCNWTIKAKAFDHGDVKIETDLARWSFLEDVILGHRLVTAYGNCLSVIPSLAVIHDPITTSGALTSATIRMRIIYRYVFWRNELSNNSYISKISFLMGMIANTILMINQRPRLGTIYECFRSYYFITRYQPGTYKIGNKFIFNR